MTNGEKIKEIFPKLEWVFNAESEYFKAHIDGIHTQCFDKEWWNEEYKEPTTKNDLAQERYQDLIEYFGDEKVAKIILENRGQFKAWLERLRWNVKRADELARRLEQIKETTKNDLGVDCISRQAVIDELKRYFHDEYYQRTSIQDCRDCFIEDVLNHLPSVTPQPRKGHWIRVDKDKLRCSKCDVIHFIAQYPQGKIAWCPNCGSGNEE